MAKPNKATQAKRGRELKKQDKRKEKEERRAGRAQDKAASPRSQNGEDPDLVGIYPGPQKPIE
jgi:hypothetical protein